MTVLVSVIAGWRQEKCDHDLAEYQRGLFFSFVRGVSFTGQSKNFPIEKAVSGESQIISKNSATQSSHFRRRRAVRAGGGMATLSSAVTDTSWCQQLPKLDFQTWTLVVSAALVQSGLSAFLLVSDRLAPQESLLKPTRLERGP